jgi:glycerol-3-phosphate dehydrogenase (NAD(P)+)
MNFGIIGSGSWGTAIAKILTDNGHVINWWNRSEAAIEQFRLRKHNPQYLSHVRFQMDRIHLTSNVSDVVASADVVIIAVPSAYVVDALSTLTSDIFENKIVLSAVKGIIPEVNLLLNDYLQQKFNFPLKQYFALLGPCHAEEVAAEKLSYLTFSGIDQKLTSEISDCFNTSYIRTVVNKDIFGVQYAAILKNIYALGSGIAHGLDYGDNFLSVLIANSADEMAGFLRKAGIVNAEVGYIEHKKNTTEDLHNNYAASVYMGDLLVTCYSLYSRNRTFGNMIGKGYSVKAAQLEMNMVAEGYNASRCMFMLNQKIMADMPIAETVYKILWDNLSPEEGFQNIEKILV